MPDQPIPAADVPSESAESNCDRIAYQFSAIVQPHACLLVLDDQLTILQATANTTSILNDSPQALIGQSLSNTTVLQLCRETLEQLKPESITDSHLVEGVTTVAGDALIGRIHRRDDLLLLELEPESHPHDLNLDHPVQFLARFSKAVSGTKSVFEVASRVASELRPFIGYERCMVYRFDPDHNGEVIAEARSESAEDTFLGLRFPTRDVPKSARRMFMDAPVRATVDQLTECSPIVPRLNPVTGEDVDLSQVLARGAAGSCQTYYRNMGVRSTLVMPIVVNDRLWGLISCHHNEPSRLSPRLEPIFQTIGRVASTAIESAMLKEQSMAEHKITALQHAMLDDLTVMADWGTKNTEHLTTLCRLLASNGFVLRLSGQCHISGDVPDHDALQSLIDKLLDKTNGQPIATHHLASVLPEYAELNDTAAGVLIVPLAGGEGDAAIWFRRESKQTIRWAGDPKAGMKWDQRGQPELTPRASFKLWQESTSGMCRRWTNFEKALAQTASANLGLIFLTWHAAQAYRAKSEFLTNVSHEIRTPMTAILGFAEMLAAETDNKDQLDHISTIIRNGNWLLAIIDDVLDLAKVDAGKITVQKDTFAPLSVVEDVRALMTDRAAAKNQTIRIVSETPLPQHISSDPTRLKQVLVNLVGNAIKFSGDGEIRIVAEHSPEQDPAQMTFGVVDSGIGIAPEHLDKIFEPFHQVDCSLTREHGGAGLGLAICTRIVDALGGRLSVTSRLGEGSSFKFTIDIGDDTVADTPVGSENVLTGCRVLLAEDAPDNQRLIERYLQRAGAAVSITEDGKEAIHITIDAANAGTPYDIILMDMQMPVLDGYDATRKLREQGYKHPIIALTAHAMANDVRKCLDAGCDAYTTKPIQRDELINVVHEYWTAQPVLSS